jgi:hypothetical protein
MRGEGYFRGEQVWGGPLNFQGIAFLAPWKRTLLLSQPCVFDDSAPKNRQGGANH